MKKMRNWKKWGATAALLCAATVGVLFQYSRIQQTATVRKSTRTSQVRAESVHVADHDAPAQSERLSRTNALDVAGRALIKRYIEAMGGPLDKYSVAELVFNLKDETLPWRVRRRLAVELARRGTDEAIGALKELAASASPELKAVIAEAFGYSKHPEAKPALMAMLRDQDEIVARGAMRGLAVLADDEAVNALSVVLADSSMADGLRAEAAAALGGMRNPSAVSSLISAFGQIAKTDLKELILSSLGKQPFDSTREFFQSVLDAPGAGSELRVAALEALGGGSDDAVPFLLRYLGDNDASARTAAAWALSMTDSSGDYGGVLAARLLQEQNAEVRTRLYQALVRQENFDFSALLPSIAAEQNLEARLAGFELWAAYCRSNRGTALAQQFDLVATPQLKELALRATQPNERLDSIIALRRAATPGAVTALHEVAAQAADSNVAEAARAAIALRK
jgi:HEAT repeat protein